MARHYNAFRTAIRLPAGSMCHPHVLCRLAVPFTHYPMAELPKNFQFKRGRYLIHRSSPRGDEVFDSDIGEYLLKTQWEALQSKQFADKDRK